MGTSNDLGVCTVRVRPSVAPVYAKGGIHDAYLCFPRDAFDSDDVATLGVVH